MTDKEFCFDEASEDDMINNFNDYEDWCKAMDHKEDAKHCKKYCKSVKKEKCVPNKSNAKMKCKGLDEDTCAMFADYGGEGKGCRSQVKNEQFKKCLGKINLKDGLN